MEKAILVNLAITRQEKEEAEKSLSELAGLAVSAGATVVEKVFQTRSGISPKYFIGEGKVEELAALVEKTGADLVISDANLTPAQQRSLEEALKVKVLDRTQVILDIFAQRARTNEGKLQVELAQLTYLLPRLKGRGQALSRLGGGIGTRGPGEKKLEEDRRRITDRITKIKKDIDSLQKRRARQREGRRKSPVPTVSLVGYTSAGKSTLFNLLTRESRYTSPHLFATLDPMVRRVTFPDGFYFFLSDTVGFIKRLPVELISAFRATLEEIREANCLLHVVDVTSSEAREQAAAVERILEDLEIFGLPVVKVFNKIDLLPESEKNELLLRNRDSGHSPIYLSALTGEGVDILKGRLRRLLFENFETYRLRIPRSRAELASSLVRQTIILTRTETDEGWEYQVAADRSRVFPYLPYLQKGENP
ncbi:MAG: GTPase HflX [Candidatus Saccharicenans sp.]|uniref:GTPase HflX n=1 Tax=Candidatus Saccharicenans sp. TaxID=2819258 RepID=UPI00404A827F